MRNAFRQITISTLVASLVLGVFGFPSSTEAQVMCCKQREGSECRIERVAGEPCDVDGVSCGGVGGAMGDIAKGVGYGSIFGAPGLLVGSAVAGFSIILSGFGKCLNPTRVPGKGPEKQVPCSSDFQCAQAVRKETDCSLLKSDRGFCKGSPNCFYYNNDCLNKSDHGVCVRIRDKAYCDGGQGSVVCRWNAAQNRCQTRAEGQLSERYARTGGLLPACAYEGSCRSVNDLVEAVIRVVKEGFKYIGSVAFAFFIYGGLTVILSFGNAERVKKGQQILVAAVVGILISFGAYMLINFILDALQVGQEFKVI